MPSPSRKSSTTDGLDLIFFTIPQEILLQLGTGTVLMAVLGGKAAMIALQALGVSSEEVFRGDRLPVLKFPVATKFEHS